MKKRLLFTAVTLDIGGIEKALINLLNNIDYTKYEVTLILEKKEGIFLNQLNKNVILKELKVSRSKNILLRKILNFSRKQLFKIKNKNKYDFSCCYATYSYSCNKLALIASSNSSIYIHSNYKDVYNNKSEIYDFFNTRHIDKFKHIIFVSNEAKDYFKELYPNLTNKLKVLNNFIDVDNIQKLSDETIEITKEKNNKLFVFVGRLDDSSKKLKRALNLVKEIKNIELWIVGDGPDRNIYEKYTSENKIIDRVKFIGKKQNPYPYMKKADYIILTSDYEGFPVTYLEAIALNKDIITTLPTSDDSIDIRNYAYIISKNQDKMVKEVKSIIAQKDKKQRIDIEKIQMNRIKKFEEMFND